MTNITYGPLTPAWAALRDGVPRFKAATDTSPSATDQARAGRLSCEAAGLYLDFSRQRMDEDCLTQLLELAEQTGVPAGIERMFAGERVNNTEDRAALHIALRRPRDRALPLDGEDVMLLVQAEREKIERLADELWSGSLRGYTGKPISDVVNIGIGGSDLGPVMAASALAEYCKPDLGLHFVSNVDGVEVSHVLDRVDPETTLFVVCSKSFTTLETLTNAQIVRDWLLSEGGEAAVAAQFVAVSTNHEAMNAFGIAADRRFAIWDWVGGRYSLWSAVGLTLALAIGWEQFQSFLSGAHEMDEHFLGAPLNENLPVVLGLIGIWNRNFLEIGSHAVLPYDDHLRYLPAYLQQLEMESNGKSVRRDGSAVTCATCPIIWGEPGSNAQHSFYQLLHQGTTLASMDFLLPAKSDVGRQAEQDLAAANCLAQTWAMAVGDIDAGHDDPHRAYPGGRPSSLLLFERLDPRTLGSLIALYEHKVYVQSIVWDINPFDQWGVQLGKQLASRVATLIADDSAPTPPAIAAAISRLRAWRP